MTECEKLQALRDEQSTLQARLDALVIEIDAQQKLCNAERRPPRAPKPRR